MSQRVLWSGYGTDSEDDKEHEPSNIRPEVNSHGRDSYAKQTMAPRTHLDDSHRSQLLDTTMKQHDRNLDAALQGYLIRQQHLAGIKHDQTIDMQGHKPGQPQLANTRSGNGPVLPPILRITNDGIFAPYIPPAQYNGVPCLPDDVSQLREAYLPNDLEATDSLLSDCVCSANRKANTTSGSLNQSISPGIPGQGIQGQSAIHAYKNDNEPVIRSVGDSQKQHVIPMYSPGNNTILNTQGGYGFFMPFHSPDAHTQSVSIKTSVQADEKEELYQRYASRTLQVEDTQAMYPAINLEDVQARSLGIRDLNRPGAATDIIRGRTSRPFNILQSMIQDSELAFHLATHLRLRELISLYAISKDFHSVVNSRFTSVVLFQATRKAPDAARIFPFRCYEKLCIQDPAHNLRRGQHHVVDRLVPSFRWLKMVFWRETVVNQIIQILRKDGILVPGNCKVAIQKLWFLMDVPDNNRRLGIIQNGEIWPETDLFWATMFFIKLDMRFTDPVTGSGRDGMRRLLLAQPTLNSLWQMLTGTALRTHLETLKAYVRWKYSPAPCEANNCIFGVPPKEVGILQFEGYGRKGSRVILQRPDELILKECIRRDLNIQRKYMDMFLWGYVKPNIMRLNINDDSIEEQEGPFGIAQRKEADDGGVPDTKDLMEAVLEGRYFGEF